MVLIRRNRQGCYDTEKQLNDRLSILRNSIIEEIDFNNAIFCVNGHKN